MYRAEARAFVYAVRDSDYTPDKFECWLVFAARVDYMKKSGTVINHFQKSNTTGAAKKKECKAPNELPLGRQNSAGRKVEDR